MKTLGRNLANDLYLEGTGLAMAAGKDAQYEIIESIILTQRGELQFDDEGGIDYFGTVFLNPRYIEVWAAQIRTAVENLEWVRRVRDFQYRFAQRESTLYWSMIVENSDGEELKFCDKKTTIDGAPGVEVKWADVVDKPEGLDTVIEMVNGMEDSAEELVADGTIPLNSRSTLRDVKKTVNALIFDQASPEYLATRSIKFSLYGVPAGVVVDLEPLYVESSSSWYVDFGDGTVLKFPKDQHRVLMDGVYTHAMAKGGTLEIAVRGAITAVKVAEGCTGPVLRKMDGDERIPLPYLSGLSIGSNVPLAAVSAEEENYSGPGVFAGLSNLATITWESRTPVTFGNKTFAGCTSIRDLQWLPSGLVGIGKGCFEGCAGLTSLAGLPVAIAEIPEECFKGCTVLSSLSGLPPATTAIGDSAFEGCMALASIDALPDTVLSVGAAAFRGCTSIRSVLYWPSAVTVIPESAFEGCTSLKSLYVSDAVATISPNAFAGCPALDNILSEKESPVPAVGEGAFPENDITVYVPYDSMNSYETDSKWGTYTIKPFGVHQYTVCNIPAGAYVVSAVSLQSSSIWAIDFGDGTKPLRYDRSRTEIPRHQYANAVDTDGVVITVKGYVTTAGAMGSVIGETSNTHLTRVEFSHSPLSSIDDLGFAFCTALSYINIGNDDGHSYLLGNYAFMGCSALNTTDWLTAGLSSMGMGCFQQSGIESLGYSNAAITSLPEYCFAETKIMSLDGIGGESLTSIGAYCFQGCESLARINGLANTGVTVLPNNCFDGCVKVESIEGIQKITSLGEHCFDGCSKLTGLCTEDPTTHVITNHLPPAITALPAYCFANCGLTSLAGLDNVTELGEYCFSGCTALTRLVALKDANITSLSTGCFKGCTALECLVGLSKVATIGNAAFEGCTGLVSTSGLGFGLLSIGSRGFYGCTGLEYVSMVADIVPSITSDTFGGTQVSSIALYVPESLVSSYRSAQYWSSFQEIKARTIKVLLEDIQNVRIEALRFNVQATYSWYIDWGDESELEVYEMNENGVVPYRPTNDHTYGDRGNYVVTFYGDIKELSSRTGMDEESIFYDARYNVATVDVSSSFIQSIGIGAFFNNTNLRSVSLLMGFHTVSDGEEEKVVGGSVGFKAFKGCTALVNVNFNNSVTDIDSYAFQDCTALSSSTGFAGVKNIGKSAFEGSSSLADSEGFGSVEKVLQRGFAGCTSLVSTTGFESLVNIAQQGFAGCTGLATVGGFSADMETIGEEAFAGCEAIRTIFMGQLVPPTTSEGILDQNVFAAEVYQNAELFVSPGCEQIYRDTAYWSLFRDNIKTRYIAFTLSDIEEGDRLRENQTKVVAEGQWAVSYGEGESTFYYPEGETILPAYTFSSGGAKVVKFSGPVVSVSAVSENAFPILSRTLRSNSSLTRVECSRMMEVVGFGDYTFANCYELEAVVNASATKALGLRCFANCISLEDVSDLSGVEIVGDYAFNGCTKLKRLDGMHSVKTIGNNAFDGCLALRYIDGLGAGVESIGTYAFRNCPLAEVQMLAPTPPEVEDTSFAGIDKATVPLYVLSTSVEAYSNAIEWNEFATIGYRALEIQLNGVAAGTATTGADGIVASDTFWVVNWGDDTSLDGKERTPKTGSPAAYEKAEMPSHEFAEAGNYTVRIEGDLASIAGSHQGESFYSAVPFLSSTTKGYVASVTAAGASRISAVEDSAFAGCNNLATANLLPVAAVGDGAFYGCAALASLEGFQNAQTIGNYSFYGCTGISNITGFGAALGSIGSNAFGSSGMVRMTVGMIQMEATTPPAIHSDSFKDVWGTDGNQIGELSSAYSGSVMVYVPRSAITSYSNADYWRSFGSNIRSLDLSFYLQNVPSGAGIIGETAHVEAASAWTVDWGDGTVDEMAATDTSLPSHLYSWTPEESSATTRNFTISIVGDIRSISATSWTSYPFLASAAGQACPYLYKVAGAYGMANLTTIGESTFKGCSGLVEVSGFKYVDTIGDSAFANCTALVDMSDFGNVVNIEANAFAGCTSLANLDAFGKARYLGDSAFSGCTSLTSTEGLGADVYEGITDPEAMIAVSSSFGENCFAGCPLPRIDSNFVAPPTITATTFAGIDTQTTKVYVPLNPPDATYDVVELYKAAPYWSEFGDNIIPKGYVYNSVTFDMYGSSYSGTPVEIWLTGSIEVAPNQRVTINWGDDTADTVLNESISGDGDTWFDPSSGPKLLHEYSSIVYGELTRITISGGLVRIAGDVNSGNYGWGIRPCLSTAKNAEERTAIEKHAYDNSPSTYNDFVYHVRCAGDTLECGKAAFCDFNDLQSILLPIATKRIPSWVCANCSDLFNEGSVRLYGKGLSLPDFYVGDHAFSGTGIVSLEFLSPIENLTEVEDGAFENCTSIEHLTGLKAPLSNIGANAFRGCTSLMDLSGMPSTVTELWDECFRGCTSLSSLVGLPAGAVLKSNGDGGHFQDCRALQNLAGMQNLTNNTEIPSHCFEGCTLLQSLTGMPYSITSIGYQSFEGCTSLQKLTGMSEMCSSVDYEGFANCGLRSLEGLSHEITELGMGCFFGCTHLEKLGGSDQYGNFYGLRNCSSLEYLPDRCFQGCTGLQSLDGCGDWITSFGEYCFAGTGLTRLYGIPSSLRTLGEWCFSSCMALGNLEDSNGCIGVMSLPAHCFDGCGNLYSYGYYERGFPEVNTMGDYCFANTGLTSLSRFPMYLHTIGEGCFQNCSSLSDISYLEDCPNLAALPANCFENCNSLTDVSSAGGEIRLDGYRLIGKPLPTSIKALGDNCFLVPEASGIPLRIAVAGESEADLVQMSAATFTYRSSVTVFCPRALESAYRSMLSGTGINLEVYDYIE